MKSSLVIPTFADDTFIDGVAGDRIQAVSTVLSTQRLRVPLSSRMSLALLGAKKRQKNRDGGQLSLPYIIWGFMSCLGIISQVGCF